MDGKWTRLVPSATLHVDCCIVLLCPILFTPQLQIVIYQKLTSTPPPWCRVRVFRAGLGSVVALEVTTLAKCSVGLVVGGWSTLITALTALIGHL